MTETAISEVALTEQAAKRIAALLSTEAPGSVFRVSVDGGGCSGFQYQFAIDSSASAEDALVERDGARVAIDPASIGFLAGAKIDFIDDLMGQSFRVENPNATASCGCGASFSL
ncbi:iron-sulfur cluster insertion protein ErpA [Methylocystis parvus]|uniref:Iron-sulfur cluster insertion protein ErpA n=1 Tax=Methylocystis parvus TaxID=134 RepID=A0A6B8M9E0_9HYPH|nr:iron-sulfur cluster insertion protein ErpA [Methylocystis parvus]QGM99218.1 iron-sulfur cluster insertion protein ErpA [Methylocystis parvus]WBK00401.1 iron-sulfur cluster insertion protein ErpA [Methylocystis parvus OBBP]